MKTPFNVGYFAESLPKFQNQHLVKALETPIKGDCFDFSASN
jgi:hypothetical protein